MSFIRKKMIGLGLILMLAISATAYPQMHDFGGKHGMSGKRCNEEHMRNLENLRLLKLLETLELSEEQNDKFIVEFANFRQKMKGLAERTNARIDTLAGELNQAEPDEKIILRMVDEIVKLREGRITIMNELHDNVRSFLTPIQVGKLIVFEERFDRELLERVRGFRRGMTPEPGEGENNAESRY